MSPLKRHTVAIYRRNTALDSRGQQTYTDELVAGDVPCSIEQLSGRELELARQIFATATARVRFFTDPAWKVSSDDYLLRENGTKLEIGYVQDRDETEWELTLTCAEERESG